MYILIKGSRKNGVEIGALSGVEFLFFRKEKKPILMAKLMIPEKDSKLLNSMLL